MTLPRKLFLTLLNSTLVLACIATVVLVTYVVWSYPSFALYTRVVGIGSAWGMGAMAIWAFWMAIKAIWRE